MENTLLQDRKVIAGRNIFMSYALLNHLVQAITAPEQVSLLMYDPVKQLEVMQILFAQRTPDGEVTALEMPEMTIDDGLELISWVSEHVLRFFIRGAEQALKMQQENQGKLTDLTQSLVGTKA